MTVPPRSAREALREYTAARQRLLSCLTRENVVLAGRLPAGLISVYAPRAPVRISARLEIDLFESLRPGALRGARLLTGQGYMYTILRDGAEVLGYHWHPEVPSHHREPHLHASLAPLGKDRLHLPTGHVTLEDIISFVITELGARPLRDDWRPVLAESRAQIGEWGTWA